MMVDIDSPGAGPEPGCANRATAIGVALWRPWVISICSAPCAVPVAPAEKHQPAYPTDLPGEGVETPPERVEGR